jgi:putative hydrolase
VVFVTMENRLKKYKKFFRTGLWHIHTNYTDGKSSIDSFCRFAHENKIPLIAFTEHVRKELTYNFNDYINEINIAKQKYPNIIILTGCETKVIDLKGNLDITREIFKKCEIVLGAFHSFPYADKKSYSTAIKNMLKKGEIDVWAHPFRYATINSITFNQNELNEILNLCNHKKIILEENKKNKLPKELFKKISNNNLVLVGSDVHKIEELTNIK